MFDEASDFTSALADQTQDDGVGLGASRHHAKQGALAHAASAEDAKALTAPAGQKGVDRPNAGANGLRDGLSNERVQRRRIERHRPRAEQRAKTINRPSEPVDDAAEQAVANRHGRWTAA